MAMIKNFIALFIVLLFLFGGSPVSLIFSLFCNGITNGGDDARQDLFRLLSENIRILLQAVHAHLNKLKVIVALLLQVLGKIDQQIFDVLLLLRRRQLKVVLDLLHIFCADGLDIFADLVL